MTCEARRLLFDYYREKPRKPCPIRLPRFFSIMAEICATPTKPLRRSGFRLDGLITPTTVIRFHFNVEGLANMRFYRVFNSVKAMA